MRPMRVLVLTKRQYMAHDLIDDRFGRFRELPLALARRGHDVTGLCLSYRSREEAETIDRDDMGASAVTWRSLNAGPLKLPGVARYVRAARRLAAETRPDVVWACSDSFYGSIGKTVAAASKSKCVFDLYDNFESFGSTKFPGMLSHYRRTVVDVEGVTCVSRPLMELVTQQYGRQKPTWTLENAVAKGIFFPRDKDECRRKLGLPVDVPIIGTAGALDAGRGIKVLFDGFERLAAGNEHLHLAIAGPRRDRSLIPRGTRIHDFGMLPLADVAVLLNALDVAVVCNRETSFGRYCFPQKAYEIMACRVPMVAASVGVMRELLAGVENALFDTENPDELVRMIQAQLRQPRLRDLDPPGWDDMGRALESFFEQVLEPGSTQPAP